MTLIAGFRCTEGILLVADREEATPSAKRSVPKICCPLLGTGCSVAFATAGNAATADLAVERIIERIYQIDDPRELFETHQELLVECLTSVYEQHIWHNPDRDRDQLDFSLITAINVWGERQFLYRTAGTVLHPQGGHVCVGVGEDLANYFADRLYSRYMSRHEVTLLAAFIFRETKQAVRDVGQGTDACFLFDGAGTYSMGRMQELERAIPDFNQIISKFWDDTKLMPNWLTDDRLDLGKEWRERRDAKED